MLKHLRFCFHSVTKWKERSEPFLQLQNVNVSHKSKEKKTFGTQETETKKEMIPLPGFEPGSPG
jgi:hypothetical protein